MPESDEYLSFSIDAAGNQLFIHANAGGLDRLIRSLNHLRGELAQGVSDHDHLWTEAWAGNELSRPPLSDGERAIEHVKIWAWTPEKIHEHHLGG